MRAALRSVSAVGCLLFLAVAIATFAGPRLFERRAKDYLVERLHTELARQLPRLAESGIVERLASKLEARATENRRSGWVHDWAQRRFDQLVQRLLRDVRIFALTNALMLFLAFLMASVDPLTRAVKVVSGALIGGAMAGTGLYLFAQDWLQTLLFSDYVGGAYVVWVALIVGAELDILLNRGRVLGGLLGGIVAAVPSGGHVSEAGS